MVQAGTLRNNIGDQRVLDDRDLVFQAQLALFQAGNLQLIGRCIGARSLGQRGNRGIEIAVLGAQQFKLLAQFLLVHLFLQNPCSMGGLYRARARYAMKRANEQAPFLPKVNFASLLRCLCHSAGRKALPLYPFTIQ